MVSTVYPPLLCLPDEAAYEAHFKAKYCQGPITTFDGIQVRFRGDKFGHDFYESSCRDGTKDRFSLIRAQRMDWIETTLKDPASALKQGWLGRENRHDPARRVALVQRNYVVVILLNVRNPQKAQFITAYVADTFNTLSKIQRAPLWTPDAI